MAEDTYAADKIAVLGAGTWGSTLAWLLASQGKSVVLWSHDPAKAALLARKRCLTEPLPVELPASVRITDNLNGALDGASVVLLCCNSQSIRELAGKIAGAACPGKHINFAWKLPVLVSAAKGLELGTLKRMSEVISELVPELPVCALSGPNLASEILKGLPAASVVACRNADIAAFVQEILNVPALRLYTNVDVAGVELGGALKNIIAIAAGISDGLGLGANSKAALLTRGLSEMTRLSLALGAKEKTLSGLAGMGDLLATCSSSLSRNYRLGLELAGGLPQEEAKKAVAATAEGIPTTYAVCELSQKLGIAMPIAEQVKATLKGEVTPYGAIMSLMKRPLGSE